MPGQTEECKDGWKGGQTLFDRTLPSTSGGRKNKIFPLKFSKSKQIYFKYSYINFVVIQSLKKAGPFCDLQ